MPASRLNPSLVEFLIPENGQPPNPTYLPFAPDPAVAAYVARQAATVGWFRQPESWVPRLRDAAGKCLGRLKGEGNIAAGSVAIYPDGRTLITGDPYGSIGCWDLTDGGRLRQFRDQHSAQIQNIAVSPNGRWLATASSLVLSQEDLRIEVWGTDDQWDRSRVYDAGEVIQLAALTLDLPVDEIYTEVRVDLGR